MPAAKLIVWISALSKAARVALTRWLHPGAKGGNGGEGGSVGGIGVSASRIAVPAAWHAPTAVHANAKTDEARMSQSDLKGYGAAVIVFMFVCSIIGAASFIFVGKASSRLAQSPRNLPRKVAPAGPYS